MRRTRSIDPLSAAFMAAGALLRVAQYLANRSLWLDEAYLTPTILQRSFRDLLSRPPDYGQVVPAGFLVLERAAAALFGSSEYALRLVPLAAGLACLPLFWRLARRVLSERAVPLAVALFAVCDPLIYFSSELKQYGLDVLVALLLLDRALAIAERPSGRSLATLAAIGALAIWFSYPAIFVLAAIAATLAVAAVFERQWPRLVGLSAAGLLWIASFALEDVLWLSRIGRAPLVLEFWARAFWPLPPRSFDDLYWLPRAFGALFGDPAGFVFRGLGIFCFLVGCFSLGPSRRQTEALLLSPFAFVLIASGFKRYPFSGRLLLFLVPSILLLVAAGGEAVREATSSRSVAIFRILVVLLLFHPVLFAARSLIHPRTREELRPVLQYVQGRRQPGDRIYVYDGAWPAFDYYASRLGLDRSSVLRGRFAGRFGDPRSDADALRGGGRAWLLFAHAQRSESVDDEARLLGLLDPSRRLDARHEPGASGYLYAFGSSQPAPSPKEQSQ